MSDKGLAGLLEGLGRRLCPRCECCELIREECEQCEDGLDGHDCGEDCCCCEFPEDNLRCQFCQGRGYFQVCLGRCDSKGKHQQAALAKLGKEQE